MTAKEIYQAIKENKSNYRVFGIRTCADAAEIGDALPCSWNWDWERDEEDWEQLDGTSATGFGYLWLDEDSLEDDLAAIEQAMKINSAYRGAHTYLIGGMDYEDGVDQAEVVISNAEVVAVIK